MVTKATAVEKPAQNVSQHEPRPAGDSLSGGLEKRVWDALAEVHDPEIPPCSITDLGIVERVEVSEMQIEVDLLPTFSGCPALDVIGADARAAVESVADGRAVAVRFVYSPPWTSDRITDLGREALRTYGITPPGTELGSPAQAFIPIGALRKPQSPLTCPFCGSRQTDLESSFGPTLCRSIHFCRDCRNPFEGFKPKTQPS